MVLFLAVLFLNRIFTRKGASIAASNSRSQCLGVSQDVMPGDFLENRMLEWRDCRSFIGKPEAGDYFWGGADELNALSGSVVRGPLTKGDPVKTGEVIRPGDADFLSAVLKPGTRAAAIRVDDVTGGAGLIRPGNLVDVLVSGKFNYETSGSSEVAAAKTLLRAVRVLAVNRDVVLQEQSPDRDVSRQAPSRDNRGTITLEVTPKGVELLTVAKTMGTLSLSLCALDDRSQLAAAEQHGHTLGTEIVAPARSGDEETAAAPPKTVVTIYGSDQSRRVTR